MIRNETGLLDDYGNDVDAYVWGESADGRHALVVMDGAAHIARIDGVRLVGLRWECSMAHLDTYAEVYRPRFSVQR